MKLTKIIPAVSILMLLVPANGQAQTTSARAEQLADMFTKRKAGSRTKYGVTRSKYREVVSTPWIVPSPSAYAGEYEGDNGERISLRVDERGRVTGSGQDDKGRFELVNASISGGILTTVKSYASGQRESVEAVFLQRSDREPFSKRNGMGYLEHSAEGIVGIMRVFLTHTNQK